ncbi:hypothetical protein NMG60_11003470 [Bertholletia excelsa]
MEVGMVDVEAQRRPAAAENEAPDIFKKAKWPVTLKFEDVVYKVNSQESGLLNYSKSEEKIILNGVTGVVLPGEMLAMLGPSGSGKTTLLTALGGRLAGCGRGRRFSGSITYSSEPFSNSMKRNTGFVTQDDVLYPHLTVRETLEKVSHAESIMTQLGLGRCRTSIIGGPLLRGISGGERKRVSIGQEMLINPSLLFLDEPTSGLDSTTAQRIVSTLWELATNGGRTVVMTIHQPSSRLFYLFHKILLLSEGNPVYFGEGDRAMDYFSTIGYTPSMAMNPSDFLLDLANGVPSDDSRLDHNEVKRRLVSAYKNNLDENIKAQVQATRPTLRQEGKEGKDSARWSTTWWQQFVVLLRRGVKERRHQSFSSLRIAQILVGLLFFYSSFWGFFPMFNAIFTFPQERMMLAKERSSGMYRLSSYFAALLVGDIPMGLVLPTIFLTITYWMAGLRPSASTFLLTLSVLLFAVLVAQGLGLALGALVMNQKSATILGSVTMLLFSLSGGYYVQHVPSFIAWIKYVSINHYSYKLLLCSQYGPNQTYPCGDGSGTCVIGDFPSLKLVGLDGQVMSVVALAAMLVGYRLVAYIALMRIGVTS